MKFLLFALFAHSFLSCEKEVDPALLPVVSTTEVSLVSYYSAQSGGVITADGGNDVVARGVCWSTSPNPTISNLKTVNAAGTGTFVSAIDSLMPNTIYYVRAFATNKKGTSYGLQKEFTTKPLTLSVVTTSTVTSITTSSVKTGGTISIDGGTPITARGVCWSTTPNPTINDSVTVDGSGAGNFISTLSGLIAGTTFYVRAYATNAQGISYGNVRQFKTLSTIPDVTTATISSITYFSAVSGGEVFHDGGEAVTLRGVCWNTSPNPTVNNSKTNNGSGNGIFTSTLSNLKSGTLYYVRAYTTNVRGTAYGNELTFTSSIGLPELTTTSVTSSSENSATTGGIITHDGGAAISTRGVCWRLSPTPTINDSKTVNGSGSGSFTSSLTALEPGTLVYVRAYATNSVGTSYGNEVIFYVQKTGEIYNSKTGKIWMDRNLGASQVATSTTDPESYGDLYQWGRGTDGHEKRNSPTTSTLSSSDNPSHGNFIAVNSGNFDWRSPQNNNLWQGENGINNPCPEGFRVPSAAELSVERASWGYNNGFDAFLTPLRLPVAGIRSSNEGTIGFVGSFGYYWSGTVSGTSAQGLTFKNQGAGVDTYRRAYGFSIRCIKD